EAWSTEGDARAVARIEHVVPAALLHLLARRAVIAADARHMALLEPRPQRRLVAAVARAQRRPDLRVRPVLLHRGFREQQILRTALGPDANAALLRVLDVLKPEPRAQMDHVRRAVRGHAHRDRASD